MFCVVYPNKNINVKNKPCFLLYREFHSLKKIREM